MLPDAPLGRDLLCMSCSSKKQSAKITSAQLEVTVDNPITLSKTCHGMKKLTSSQLEVTVDTPIIPSKTCHGMKKVASPDSEIVLMHQSYQAKLTMA